MTLYFPVWLAYVAYLVLGASALYLLVWIEIQCWFQFCEAFVKAFRYKRAFILFLKHHEYRELYGEMEDWREKYKALLSKNNLANMKQDSKNIEEFLAQKEQD